MSWIQIHRRSISLGKETELQVLLPEVGTPPFPTLYLLHSLGDDSSAWLRNTCLERAVRKYPLAVVLPDGGRGFFTNNEHGPAYAKFIGEETIAFIERNFNVSRERSARAIGGVSMGGYGALRVGLAYPSTFCSIHSQCGSLIRNVNFSADPAQRPPLLKNRPEAFFTEMRRVFGEEPTGTDHDVFVLAQRAKLADQLPGIWLDCGMEDLLLSDNRAFHGDLQTIGINTEYHEFPGSHGWNYCDAHVEEILRFHAQNLGIPTGG